MLYLDGNQGAGELCRVSLGILAGSGLHTLVLGGALDSLLFFPLWDWDVLGSPFLPRAIQSPLITSL